MPAGIPGNFPVVSGNALPLHALLSATRACCCWMSRLSSLDTALKADLLQEFAALQKLLGITTVYITHDPAEAAALAHRIAIMRGGRIVEAGSVKELRKELVERSLLKNLEPK